MSTTKKGMTAAGIVALLLLPALLLVPIGGGLVLLLAGVSVQSQTSEFCIADTAAGSQDEGLRLTLAGIGDAVEATSTGLNAAALLIAAGYVQSQLQPGTVATVRAAGDGPAGLYKQARGDFPDSPPARFGTLRDPRIDARAASTRLALQFSGLMRDGGAGSGYESQASVQAALTSLGIDGSARTWSRFKRADLAARLGDPTTSTAFATLANAILGFAPAGVAAEPTAQARWRAAWPAIVRHVEPMLSARAAAAAAGTQPYFFGDTIGLSISEDLSDAGWWTSTQVKRAVSAAALTAGLSAPKARTAQTWVIELGAFNAATDVARVGEWISAVEAARGAQEVFWVAPWRPSQIPNPEPAPIIDLIDPVTGDPIIDPDTGLQKRGPDPDWPELVPHPLGPSTGIASALRSAAASRPWLHVMPWDTLAEGAYQAGSSWFSADDGGWFIPTADGEDALVAMLTNAIASNSPDDILGECGNDLAADGQIVEWEVQVAGRPGAPSRIPAGTTEISLGSGGMPSTATSIIIRGLNDAGGLVTTVTSEPVTLAPGRRITDIDPATASKTTPHDIVVTITPTGAVTVSWQPPDLPDVVVLDGPVGRFRDGAAPLDATTWVPQVLARARKALAVPPCDDNPARGPLGCSGLCAQLSARLQGQSHGYYRPGAKTWAYSMFLAIRDTTDVDRGLVGSGREFTPPAGAMLYWYMGPDHPGHVATYIGNGQIVTNYKDRQVVQMPAERMVGEYSGYLGWLLPPKSWR